MYQCPDEKVVRFVRESICFLEQRPYFLELILHAEGGGIRSEIASEFASIILAF